MGNQSIHMPNDNIPVVLPDQPKRQRPLSTALPIQHHQQQRPLFENGLYLGKIIIPKSAIDLCNHEVKRGSSDNTGVKLTDVRRLCLALMTYHQRTQLLPRGYHIIGRCPVYGFVNKKNDCFLNSGFKLLSIAFKHVCPLLRSTLEKIQQDESAKSAIMAFLTLVETRDKETAQNAIRQFIRVASTDETRRFNTIGTFVESGEQHDASEFIRSVLTYLFEIFKSVRLLKEAEGEIGMTLSVELQDVNDSSMNRQVDPQHEVLYELNLPELPVHVRLNSTYDAHRVSINTLLESSYITESNYTRENDKTESVQRCVRKITRLGRSLLFTINRMCKYEIDPGVNDDGNSGVVLMTSYHPVQYSEYMSLDGQRYELQSMIVGSNLFFMSTHESHDKLAFNGGHYVTVIKQNNIWWCLDDDVVIRIGPLMPLYVHSVMVLQYGLSNQRSSFIL